MSLEQLKMLRNRRVEQQYIELQTYRKTLDNWLSQVHAKEQQISDFKQWRIEYQNTLFQDLQNHPFNVASLNHYHATLNQLEQDEAQLHTELTAIIQSMRQAEAEVEEARQKSKAAVLKLEKVKEMMQQGVKKPLV